MEVVNKVWAWIVANVTTPALGFALGLVVGAVLL